MRGSAVRLSPLTTRERSMSPSARMSPPCTCCLLPYLPHARAPRMPREVARGSGRQLALVAMKEGDKGEDTISSDSVLCHCLPSWGSCLPRCPSVCRSVCLPVRVGHVTHGQVARTALTAETVLDCWSAVTDMSVSLSVDRDKCHLGRPRTPSLHFRERLWKAD